MKPNLDLLEKTYDHIVELDALGISGPDAWEQGDYRCGSGKCFAGWAAQLAGGEWAFGPHEGGSNYLLAEPREERTLTREGKQVVSAHARARRILGLNPDQAYDLFDGRNNLKDIRKAIDSIKKEAA